MDAHAILLQIENRLGFVPPFFSPAADHPEVLANLWQQTESAYLDNALPALFKEKLAALLGRYCEVPYCLLCHTCTLRPLGMGGSAIYDLLTQPHPSDEQTLQALERLRAASGQLEVATSSAEEERDICSLAGAIYFAGPLAAASRSALRSRLTAVDYRNLVVFTSYNKMCHDWMAAHPEVSYELDQRYRNNFGPLCSEAPALAELLVQHQPGDPSLLPQKESVVAARVAEAEDAIQISERRLIDVFATIRQRAAAAADRAAEKEELAEELRRTAAFAGELLAIVSHDLRNPLSNILMGSQLILQLGSGSAAIAKAGKQVIKSAERAVRLIHELLDFSLARAGGGIPVQLAPLELQTLIQSSVDDMKTVHPERRIIVQHHATGQVEWDADRIAQVLSNLLANAVSHGRPDSAIDISVQGDAHALTLSVSNENKNGPIPSELMPVLFDPFKRGVPRAVSATRSIGLGLYIVREIVHAHRGSVDVESLSTGTTFTVRLPRTASSAALPSIFPK